MNPGPPGPEPRDPSHPARPRSSPSRTVILIGLRGAGKTSVARALAAQRALPCVDLDDVVAARAGHPTVGLAFTALGEPTFRALEAQALSQCLLAPPCVLSLGGGTPTAPGAPDLLRAAVANGADLLYLRAQPATLRARLAATDLSSRPALTPGAAPAPPGHSAPRQLAEIDTVFAQRDPLYLSLATRVIETDSLTIAEACALAAA